MGKDQKHTILYFGSFDPVHIGHMIIAEYFANLEEVREVWFVLSPVNPFKQEKERTHEQTRLKLLKIAIGNQPCYRICDIEFSMEPPHYTYKTMQKLEKQFPEHNFALLIGGDNLFEFDKWKNYREILDQFPVYVYPRPGYDTAAFNEYPNLHKTQAPMIGISSSQLRENLANGLSARFLLPEGVYAYIVKHRLYQSPNAS
ncbi:MAG: nicotinate (nicotinamide) nucleotide adenylyltransferase [Bacteroidota bacterium]